MELHCLKTFQGLAAQGPSCSLIYKGLCPFSLRNALVSSLNSCFKLDTIVHGQTIKTGLSSLIPAQLINSLAVPEHTRVQIHLAATAVVFLK